MTTTTKIFIILVCLFAFIFTPMAIQFAARTYDWQRLANDYKDLAETSAAHEQALNAMRESELADMAARQRAYADELARQLRTRHELNQQIADLTSQRDKLALSTNSLRSTNELLSASLNVISGQYDQLTKANNALTKSELELQTRNAELTNTIKDLMAQKVVLQQQLQQREQQIVAYRDENDRLRNNAGLGRGGEPSTVGPQPTASPLEGPVTPKIIGKIRTVEGNLATIDVGSSSGVREGARFVVLRMENGKENWICDLVITSQISPNEAVGEVAGGNGRMRPGDKVQDLTSFNSRG